MAGKKVKSDTSHVKSPTGIEAETSSESNADEKPTPVENAEQKAPVAHRYDIVLWMFGILFIVLIHSMIFGCGAAQGWDAASAYNHNVSNSSMERFLSKPFVPEPGVYKRSDDQASSRWYYWKLKPSLVTGVTKLFPWIGYSLHNLFVWLVLYLQQKSKLYPKKGEAVRKRYTSAPDKYNITLFMINIVFHLLHLLNTHTTYDGTAADTSEASSQSSVIVALILMLFIEFNERGILFGFPSQDQLRRFSSSIWMTPVYLVRKFHGYFIYWAAIYTFWYHPMENTVGHVFGFTHTWFMMLQGSLAYQTLHLNKYWRFVIETWVTVHAGVVAYQTVPNIMGKELWPMFLFGFATVIILTQLYGLPFWKDLPAWTRAIPSAVYIIVAVTAFYFIKDTEGRSFTRLSEIIRIPGIYYLILLIGWLVIVACIKLRRVIRSRTRPGGEDAATQSIHPTPSTWEQVTVLMGVVLTYAFSVFLSWILEYLDLPYNLMVFTIIYCTVFMLLSAIGGSLLLMMILPVRNIK